MRVGDLIKRIDAISVSGPTDAEVTGVVCDSRKVRPGAIFVAVAGHKADGWSFVNDALNQGAVAVVGEREGTGSPAVHRNGGAGAGSGKKSAGREACLVRVADARLAEAELAAMFHGSPSGRLEAIGVTGTNGKTTTCYMARRILRADGRSPGLLGTVEYQVGDRVIPADRTTPDAGVLQGLLAQMVGAGCRSVVMEVSSHALDQKRVWGIDFDAGVFTNLTRDHLDYHGTMESYFDAKSLLFSRLGRGAKKAFAVINTDDEWGRRLCGLPGMKAEVRTYGLNASADVQARDVSLDSTGSAFRVCSPWGESSIRSAHMGKHNVSNILGAIAACGSLGVKLDLMASCLSGRTEVPGRLEKVETGRGFAVYVDYAHTDDALRNVLTSLRGTGPRRIIVVFGCGGDRDRSKRPAMGREATSLADYAIITSDNPRKEAPSAIIADILPGCDGATNFEVIEERALAIKRSLELAREGDVVLIAGKGHETYQEFANTVVPFDDRQVARKCLAGDEGAEAFGSVRSGMKV